MNGAQALVRTLVDAGVDVCFMNPGTSEMHFVAALDDGDLWPVAYALFKWSPVVEKKVASLVKAATS